MPKPRIKFPRTRAPQTWTVKAIAAAYQWPKVTPLADMKIGIVSLGGGHLPSDAASACAAEGFPAPVITDISVRGAVNKMGSDADVENALDIQNSAKAYSAVTGKPAQIVFASAPNDDTGIPDAVAALVAAGCTQISISWGMDENDTGAASCQSQDAVFARAVAAGAEINAASGDGGSSDGTRKTVADFPSSSPHVTGCGATTKTPTGEIVWDANGGASGGGYSDVFPVQVWQVGVPAGPGRMVPDIAMNGDPDTGYPVTVNGEVQIVGGTSAVAPLYSGLKAGIAAGLGKKLGNTLPVIWSHPAAFADITQGSNGAFRAQAGPDPCTGLGVPIGTALLNVLIGGTPTPPPGGNPPPPTNPPPTTNPPVPPVSQTITVPVPQQPVFVRTFAGNLPLGFVPAYTLSVTIPASGASERLSLPDLSALLAAVEKYGSQLLSLAIKYGEEALPIILADVRQGKTLQQIEADVLQAVLLGQLVG